MQVTQTAISGAMIIDPKVFEDTRGFFVETYSAARYRELGIPDFVQDNMSLSKAVGVMRGLHYQTTPFSQGKLVQVIQGAVFDVAVDVRRDSPTFGAHVAVELSAANHRQFFIPAGCAHGFMTLLPDTLFAYKCTNLYSPKNERGIRWDDPELHIAWPAQSELTIADRDRQFPTLSEIRGNAERWDELLFVSKNI